MVKCSQEGERGKWGGGREKGGVEAARSASSVPQPLLVLPGLQYPVRQGGDCVLRGVVIHKLKVHPPEEKQTKPTCL